MKYDDTSIAERYQAARALPREVLVSWLEPLESHLQRPPSRVLDLGCGTGRFSETLGDFFAAEVIGVDVSATMLRKAKSGCDPRLCRFLRADAARLPVASNTIDLAFLSMVYHHIDPRAVGAELRRVLRGDGIVAIRNSTVECLDKVLYCDFFPAAAEHNRRHLPPRSAVVSSMTSLGLVLAAHHTIEQPIASSWSEYCEKIGARVYSDLAQISDEEFEEGLSAMRSAAFEGPVEEPIDLFIFRT